ncbi:MAG: CRISPR-associated protein Cas5 [Planctomycetia bacterium]|nr:CRISPR-associated protein Cas5 [Planctomycetia bacterium]
MRVNKKYGVSFEISGPMAMFTRPDTGSSFVSYPAPTWSGCKAMFECVARLKTAYIHPVKVNICRPLVYQHYTTNYNGPLRKGESIRKGNPYQLATIVLVNVCYQVFGEVRELAPLPEPFNHLHYLQDKFNRRLKKGMLFSTPCLGWSEFLPDYFGPLREGTKVEESVNLEIPSMLFSVFDQPEDGEYAPIFMRNVRIEKGVLRYAE